MQYNYKTENLLREGVNFAALFPDKQDVVKEMTGFQFDLSKIVTFLKKETNDFKNQIPLAIDIDNQIYSIYMKWMKGSGKQEPKDDSEEEPIPQDSAEVAEWKEAIQTLKTIIKDDLGTEEEVAQWQEAIDILESLL